MSDKTLNALPPHANAGQSEFSIGGIRLENSLIWPLAIALFMFMLIAGPSVLIPNNIAWMDYGDAATNYLGWQSYRDSPWTWPPFENPGYGAEFARSIVYTDSLPIAAIIAKVVSPFMPQPFNFFGYWLLMCIVLQSIFAWKLVGLFEKELPLRAICTTLLAFSPAMIIRFTEGYFNTAHLALASHFLILACLFECLRPSTGRRAWVWLALIGFALLTHAYMFAIVGMFWIASLADDVWRKRFRIAPVALETIAVGALVVTIWNLA
ncbi:MAG: DUF6311 domain-containing protein, partial [Pseudomonadota bacterium]